MKILFTILFLFSLPLMAAKVGTTAGDFTLKNQDGKAISLSSLKGKYVVLEWLNHECPYVKKHYNAGNMQALQKKYTAKDVVWVSIISSAKDKQGYMAGADIKKTNKEKKSMASHVLIDADGKVGKLYDAKTTPHMYVINPEGILIYKGAIDSEPTTDVADVKGATNYVALALDAAMAGKNVITTATRAYGCSVKY